MVASICLPFLEDTTNDALHGSPRSGQDHAEWRGKIFDDPTVAAAMLGRLRHKSVVFNIDGDSYRMRTHRAR